MKCPSKNARDPECFPGREGRSAQESHRGVLPLADMPEALNVPDREDVDGRRHSAVDMGPARIPGDAWSSKV